MDIDLVICSLKELSGWVSFSEYNRKKIEETVEKLEHWSTLSEAERGEIKHLLSCDMMFHIKWLGDLYVPGFTGEGPGIPWWNYLHKIADICQKNL